MLRKSNQVFTYLLTYLLGVQRQTSLWWWLHIGFCRLQCVPAWVLVTCDEVKIVSAKCVQPINWRAFLFYFSAELCRVWWMFRWSATMLSMIWRSHGSSYCCTFVDETKHLQKSIHLITLCTFHMAGASTPPPNSQDAPLPSSPSVTPLVSAVPPF